MQRIIREQVALLEIGTDCRVIGMTAGSLELRGVDPSVHRSVHRAALERVAAQARPIEPGG